MISPLQIILVIIMIVGLIVMIRMSRGTCGYCIFCTEQARRLSQLPEAEKKQIMQYFEKVEGRSVIPGIIIVCKSCNRVRDDKIAAHTIHGTAIQCKSCSQACLLKDSMSCQGCGVSYRWQSFPEFGKFRFLVPYKDETDGSKAVDAASDKPRPTLRMWGVE